MSVKQLEAAVEKLNETELAEFRQWFEKFAGVPHENESDDLPACIREELDARLDALDADPSLSVPWEGTKESALRRIDEILAAKAGRR